MPVRKGDSLDTESRAALALADHRGEDDGGRTASEITSVSAARISVSMTWWCPAESLMTFPSMGDRG
jgi:hypothetical protein